MTTIQAGRKIGFSKHSTQWYQISQVLICISDYSTTLKTNLICKYSFALPTMFVFNKFLMACLAVSAFDIPGDPGDC